MTLPHFSIVPNSAMKDLISKWCRKHEISIPKPCSDPIPAALLSWNSSSSCSITSLGGSFSDVQMPTPTDLSYVSIGSSEILDNVSLGSAQMNDDSHTYQSSTDISNALHSNSLFEKFTSLPWELLCKEMGDIKNQLMENSEACYSMLNDNFGELLIQFLKEACELCDVEAQRDGAQVILAFMRKSGTGIPSLSVQDIRFHILQTTHLSKVISLLSDSSPAEYCLKIVNHLCETEEGRIAVGEANGCISSMAELLEIGTHEQQEQALSDYLFLCLYAHQFKYSQLALKGVIQLYYII